MPAPASSVLARPSIADEPVLVEALFHATRAFRHRLRPELEREGLTAPMFWTLHQLVVDGPRNVGQIAEACVVTPANVSSSVEQLKRSGLVDRQPGPRDRRVVVVSATARGRALHRTVWRRLGQVLVRSLVGVRPDDLEATARVLGRLAASGAEAVVLAPEAGA
ncbi:MAG TPA: MarR family transcriptional regulator [Thermoplasmata archaeon]|nr:MarR family transcriptional regulator [Thermoplasmata archaeon]